jgi:hypothetical protein
MSEKKKSNLDFWNSVCTTIVAHTKEVSQGRRKFSAIDAYYQIQTATEKFGPYGIGWGVREPVFTVIGELMMYQATLFYNLDGKEGLIPIESSANMWMGKDDRRRLDDDVVKKLGTDAITKGLSRLGFNADVFLGKFDDNKYVQELKENQEKEGAASLKEDLIAELGMTTDLERVKAIWTGNPSLKTDPEYADAVKKANNRLNPQPAK